MRTRQTEMEKKDATLKTQLKHKMESVGYWYKESNRIRGESATKTTELKDARQKLQDSANSQAEMSRQLEDVRLRK
jgi:hypothetical protein